jgi:hypothetical protein
VLTPSEELCSGLCVNSETHSILNACVLCAYAASVEGGCIYLEGTAHAHVHHCGFTANTATFGGSVFLTNATQGKQLLTWVVFVFFGVVDGELHARAYMHFRTS